MATSDIRIGTMQRPMGRAMISSNYIDASSNTGVSKRSPFLLIVLRKRWYLLIFILPLTTAIAYGVATYYGSHSFRASTTLLYTGLPMPSGHQVYKPLDFIASDVLITDPDNINRVLNLHGLSMPPSIFAKIIEIDASRGGVLKMSLTWSNPEEAIAILSDLSEGFIQQVANQRRKTVQEYLPEIERSLLAEKAKIVEATNRLQIAKEQIGGTQDWKFLNSNSDILLLENALDIAEVEKHSIENQIASINEAKKAILDTARSQILEISDKAYDKSLSRYAENHPDRQKIIAAKNQIKTIAKADDGHPISDVLVDVIQASKRWVAAEELQEYSKLLPFESKMSTLVEQRDKLEISLLTKTRELERLQKRLVAKRDEISKNKTQMTEQGLAVSRSNEIVDRLNSEIQEANSSRSVIQGQLNSLRQLESTQVHEFTVITPPSMKTVSSSSNRKKLFLGSFFLAGLIFIAPIFSVEWLFARENPLEEASRVFSLPVLGRNIIAASKDDPSIQSHEQESVRILTLRIQQSLCGVDAATIIFSSLDRSEPAAYLIAEIAKCFAEREERVLILDASGFSTCHEELLKSLNQRQPVLHITQKIAIPSNQSVTTTTDAAERHHGLAEYLTQENLTLKELLQTTADPQVDYISGGDQPLPRECFATRRLTNLLLDCRKEYSTILVIGPTAYRNADLQMLSARADGIVFTVGKGAKRCKTSYAALQELLELEAPVLGVVG